MKTLTFTTLPLLLPTALAVLLQPPTNCDQIPLPNPTTTTIYSKNVDQLITLISDTQAGRELYKSLPSSVKNAYEKFQHAQLKHSSTTPYIPLHIARKMYDYIVQHKLHCFPTPRALWGYLIQLDAVDFHGHEASPNKNKNQKTGDNLADEMIGAKFKLSPNAITQISASSKKDNKEKWIGNLPTLLTGFKKLGNPNTAFSGGGGSNADIPNWTGANMPPISGMGMQNINAYANDNANDAEEPPIPPSSDQEDYYYNNNNDDDFSNDAEDYGYDDDSDDVVDLPDQTGSSADTNTNMMINPWAPGGDLEDKRRRRRRVKLHTYTEEEEEDNTSSSIQFFDLHVLRELEAKILDFTLPVDEIIHAGILNKDEEDEMKEVVYPWQTYARIVDAAIRAVEDIIVSEDSDSEEDEGGGMRERLVSEGEMRAGFAGVFKALGGFPWGPVPNIFVIAPEEVEAEEEEEGRGGRDDGGVGPFVKGG
ncbi:hypothetical protein AA313_de0201145 [Arthrobotrys entomopaga]|nr:hypothetical protein AA313_de0201145 [Arthrobotrys entomopaga]